MVHANARLTVHGRQLLVDRVLVDGRKPAHVAAELGVSRQCAYRWVRRYREEAPPAWLIGRLDLAAARPELRLMSRLRSWHFGSMSGAANSGSAMSSG